MNSRGMVGWIWFAGMLMVVLGGIAFFEGLIAILRSVTWPRAGEGRSMTTGSVTRC